jgi:Winged helix-turn helix
MKPPTFVGPLTAEDRQHLEAGLRSPDAFTLRRSQILLASARGYRPSEIAPVVGCSVQGIRDAIRAFRAEGLGCLRAKPKTPKTIHAAWPKGRDEDLRALLHQPGPAAAPRPGTGRRPRSGPGPGRRPGAPPASRPRAASARPSPQPRTAPARRLRPPGRS